MQPARGAFARRSLGAIGQAATAAAAVGLAIAVVTWMAMFAPEQEGGVPDNNKGEVRLSRSSPTVVLVLPPPGLLILIVRDDVQAAEVRNLVESERRVRDMAAETPRDEWIVVAPDADLLLALEDDANMAAAGTSQASIRVVDLR